MIGGREASGRNVGQLWNLVARDVRGSAANEWDTQGQRRGWTLDMNSRRIETDLFGLQDFNLSLQGVLFGIISFL